MGEETVTEFQREDDVGQIDEAVARAATAFIFFEKIAGRMIGELRFGRLGCGTRHRRRGWRGIGCGHRRRYGLRCQLALGELKACFAGQGRLTGWTGRLGEAVRRGKCGGVGAEPLQERVAHQIAAEKSGAFWSPVSGMSVRVCEKRGDRDRRDAREECR